MRAHPADVPGQCRAFFYAALAGLCLAVAAPAQAGDLLSCGVPLTRHLDTGATDSYGFAISTDAATVVDAAYVSTTNSLVELGAPSIPGTCAGSIEVQQPSSATVTVSDCVGNGSGDYAIEANVVADVPQNCGLLRPMPCGANPHVQHLTVQGQVDAFTFAATQGDQVTITGTDVSGLIGGVNLRLYDPTGKLLTDGDTCNTTVPQAHLAKTGTYTVLAGVCGQPQTGFYGIGFQAPACPAGPDITYFGIARPDGSPEPPLTYDDAGRAVYQTRGTGFFIVIEAQPGPHRTPVGMQALDHDPNDPTVLPDLQVLLSRPLGDGSPGVCDKNGVPSVPTLDFADTQTVADAINDFGCHVDDGMRHPQGVTNQDACTFFPDGDYHFVNPSSTLQFCTTPVSRLWSFPQGDTIVKARVRDQHGVVGAERAIVVRVGTRPPCPGDCNGDGEVTIDELILATNIVLEVNGSTLSACSAADANGDGVVAIDDIVKAVGVALGSCPL